MEAEQEVVVIDLDGTITRHGFFNLNIPLPWWLWFFFDTSFFNCLCFGVKAQKRSSRKNAGNGEAGLSVCNFNAPAPSILLFLAHQTIAVISSHTIR